MARHELQELKRKQEQRAERYVEFARGFKELLRTGDDEAYTELVNKLKGEFAELSSGVNTIEQRLRDIGEEAWADRVRRLQENEREKLQMTCTLHVLRREHAKGRWLWQRESEAEDPLEPRKAEPASDKESGGAGTCTCSIAAEPTEEEYEKAVQEATQRLEQSVESINELLDEMDEWLEQDYPGSNGDDEACCTDD